MVSLLPKVIQDESTLALEKCAAKALEVNAAPFMIYLVDKVDARLLPFLAEAFHVQGDEGWNYCRNEQEKRELIKSSVPLHQYKGTDKAVLDALKVLKAEGTIERWHEYDGIPFHFRLSVDLMDRGLDEETEAALLRLVDIYKNKRSILDSIEYFSSSECQSKTGLALVTEEIIEI